MQNELNGILYELNAKNLLNEDQPITDMPRLEDYIDLGVEVIADKVGDVTEEPVEPEVEEDKKSA